MTIQQDYTLKPKVIKNFTATGVIGPDILLTNMMGNLRVVVENVGASTILIQGRLTGQTAWVTLETILGATSGTTVDIGLVDEVRANCTVYAASGGTPKFIASGFFSVASGGGGGGAVNDAANIGAGGIGLYDSLVGDTLQFRNINAGSSKVSVTLDGPNSEVDIDVDPSQIDISDLGGVLALGNSKFVGTDSSGDLETIGSWNRTSTGGAEVIQSLTPANIGSTSVVLNRKGTTLAPTNNITDFYYQDADYLNVSGTFDVYDLTAKESSIDVAGSVDANNITLTNRYFNFNSSGDFNEMSHDRVNTTLGNGTDTSSNANNFHDNITITVNPNHTTQNTYLYNNNVNVGVGATAGDIQAFNSGANLEGVVGSVYGMLYSPNVASTATVLNVNALYSNPQINSVVGSFTGASVSCYGTSAPTNYTGFIVNPDCHGTITNFQGLGINTGNNNLVTGFNGINITGDVIGNFYNGLSMNPTAVLAQSFNGVNINPQSITGALTYAAGIVSNMSNVTVYAGVDATLVLQDLTYTCDQVGTDGNNVTIEYTAGGTAGSEVVTVVGLAISVQIDSGVSTATQVKAAVDASIAASLLIGITISGTAGNAQVTVAATNLAGGIDAGQKYAADFNGDVNINGALAFNGALSVGKFSAFASEALVDGGGTPSSVHSLITQPTVAANVTIANADLLGVNTAALITIGANATVTTAFLGVSALGLPAVLTMGAGATVDKVSGAVFALSLDAGSGGGTADVVSLCRSLAIPNGITTVNRLYGYEFDLPFGDPGTDSYGLYIKQPVNNWIEGSLRIGGTTVADDKVTNSSIELELTSKALRLANMDTTARNALTAVAGMVIFNTTTSAMEYYDGASWV